MSIDVDNLTIGQARQIAAMFGQQSREQLVFDNGMIGKYVIARCRDAGVHAGVLRATNGRECVLTEARRLWYWKIAGGRKGALNGVATYGLSDDSKVGVAVSRIHLTENCELIEVTPEAEASIRGVKDHEG